MSKTPVLPSKVEQHFERVLKHVYINPLEKCNLRCKICYTRKTDPILSLVEILDFVDRYKATQSLESVTLCGGEVFALSYLPDLINHFEERRLFTQIITNGTIDQLDSIQNPNNVNLIVSLDGIEPLHDANRGPGMYQRSLSFLKKAQLLGFHIEIFSIVHQRNINDIPYFEEQLTTELGMMPDITYHPRKPPQYLQSHPESNISGQEVGFEYLSKMQIIQLMKTKRVFPPPDLGCYQLAIASDGRVFGCCEGTIALGRMTEEPSALIGKLRKRLEFWSKSDTTIGCLGCSQSEFMCGIKEYLVALHNERSVS